LGFFSFKKKEESDTEEENEPTDDIRISKENLDVNLRLSKIAAQIESLMELRNVYNARFEQISEQTGSIRMMATETSRSIQLIEQTAAKATELIEQVKAEKILTAIAKQEQKVELLKANVESNEHILHTILDELKDVRAHMAFYKGTEQMIQMQKEIKDDLVTMKKMERNVESKVSKAEQLFIDVEKLHTRISYVEKEYSEFDLSVKANQEKMDSILSEVRTRLSREIDTINKDMITVKVGLEHKVDQKDQRIQEDKLDLKKRELEEKINLLAIRLDKLKESLNKVYF
jgi:hypothetical protein